MLEYYVGHSNRCHYMDENTGERLSNFAAFCARNKQILARLVTDVQMWMGAR